jgi:hypothetical protein
LIVKLLAAKKEMILEGALRPPKLSLFVMAILIVGLG